MSRNTPRSRRAAPAARASGATADTPNAVLEPIDSGWQRSLDITRTVLGASLGTSQEWMRGLSDWQQAQAASMRSSCERFEQLASQAEVAPDWPSLWALQATLASSQWTQAMQDCSSLLERAMQIEARVVERSRTDATRLSQRWLGDVDGGPGHAAPDALDANVPQAMLTQAQATMNDMSRLWTQALYNTKLPE
jgi:hypothetical protein